MRAELVDAAFDLVVQRGYDHLTTTELAESLGISRASLFRYLGSKEEVVIAGTLGSSTVFADELADVSAGPDVGRWHRLREAVEPAVRMAESSPDRMRSRLLVILETPALGARLRRARSPQIESLATALVGVGHAPFEASILATTAVAVLDQCWSTWARDDSAVFRSIVNEAFSILAAN